VKENPEVTVMPYQAMERGSCALWAKADATTPNGQLWHSTAELLKEDREAHPYCPRLAPVMAEMSTMPFPYSIRFKVVPELRKPVVSWEGAILPMKVGASVRIALFPLSLT
jgi:hypothetical protein